MATSKWLAALTALIFVFTVPGSWLVGTRIALLAVGVLALLCYMSEDRTRPFATLLAILVGGSSLALIVQGLTLPASPAEPWLVLYVFAQTCVIVGNRGNVAHMLLRRAN